MVWSNFKNKKINISCCSSLEYSLPSSNCTVCPAQCPLDLPGSLSLCWLPYSGQVTVLSLLVLEVLPPSYPLPTRDFRTVVMDQGGVDLVCSPSWLVLPSASVILHSCTSLLQVCSLLGPNVSVLEFGSGGSTTFFRLLHVNDIT